MYNDSKIPWKLEQILQKAFFQMKRRVQYKDKVKATQKKDACAKRWDNYKTFLSDKHFELKEDKDIGTK